jgi:hypothetical protein
VSLGVCIFRPYWPVTLIGYRFLAIILGVNNMKYQIVFVEIYGHIEKCKLLARHGKYVMDVERLSDGKCFRVNAA